MLSTLITQRSLFESNGFTHYRADAPRWNPDYRMFADYEFFLGRLRQWGGERSMQLKLFH
jgi:hypothetical protein